MFSYAARDGREAEAKEVSKLRAWLKPWCVRHGATLHEAEANQGLRVSIVSGVTALLREHERIIVLEDDIVVSPVFLQFMHQALEAFRDRDDVFQVSGHFVPHRQKLPAAGLLRIPACWGWGTWRRAWRYYSDDAAALLSTIKPGDVSAFDIGGSYANFEALNRNAEGTLNTWFIRWYASIFQLAGLTVYPSRSLTRNIGFGGGGTNCGKGVMDKTFRRQNVDPGPLRVRWETLGETEDAQFVHVLEEFYRWQNKQWGRPSWRMVWVARWRRLTGRPWRNITHES